MPAGTNSNVGVPTTVSIVVTKNSDLTYNITSGDTNNAAGWVVIAGAYDYVSSFSSLKNKVMNEVRRQILQI
jgi:hypothetical protein